MEIIGINKCSSLDNSYYTFTSQNININLDNINLDKISSISLGVDTYYRELIKKYSLMRVLININTSILYNEINYKGLTSLEHNILKEIYIKLPIMVDGENIYNYFVKDKIKIEVFIENISYKLLDKNILMLSTYILTKLNIDKDYYISYVIDNNLYESVYVSYSNGDNFKQNTKKPYEILKNLYYQSNSNLIFIGKSNSNSNIYLLKNHEERTLLDNNIYKDVIEFKFIDKNQIIFIANDYIKTSLYKLNLININIEKINTPNIKNIENLKINKFTKHIYFTSLQNNNILYCLDSHMNLNKIFDFLDVIDFELIEKNNILLIKVLKDDKENLFTLDLNSNDINKINIDVEYEKIIKYKGFIKDNNYKIFMLLKTKDNNLIICYDFINFEIDLIYKSEKIINFEIDSSTSDIFICIKDKNYYEILKVYNNNILSILRTSNNIKEISIKGNT